MNTSGDSATIFHKGDNFNDLFVFLYTDSLLKKGHLQILSLHPFSEGDETILTELNIPSPPPHHPHPPLNPHTSELGIYSLMEKTYSVLLSIWEQILSL